MCKVQGLSPTLHEQQQKKSSLLPNCFFLSDFLIYIVIEFFKVSSRVEKDYNDLFDGDDTSSVGDFLNDNAVEIPSFSKGIINEDDDNDDVMLAADHDLGDDENSVGMTLTLCM